MFETDGIKIEVDPVIVIENVQSFATTSDPNDKIDDNELLIEEEQEVNPIEGKFNHEGSIKPEYLESGDINNYEARDDDLDENLDNNEVNDFENEENYDESDLKNEVKNEEKSPMKVENKSMKKVKKFRCLICNKIPSGMKLKEHIVETHGEGPYECILCNDSLQTIKDLREHRWKHYSKELVQCKVHTISDYYNLH